MEPRKVEKPTLPIIPHSSVSYNQDASSLLHEVFHDVLEEPVLPENIIENWCNYRVDSEIDRKTAQTIHTIIEKSKLEIEALQIVEKKLAINIETHLAKEKEQDADPTQKEFKRYKRDPIFPSIDLDDVKEYGLITGEDIMPSKILQKLDFSYEQKRQQRLKSAKGNVQKTTATVLKLPKINAPAGGGKTATATIPPHEALTTKQDIKAWNTLCLREGARKKTAVPRKPLYNPKDFRVDKEEIVFNEYSLNVVYKQRFKLQNVSNSLHSIFLPEGTEEQSSCFKVVPQFDSETLRLCAGMSAWFIVLFKSDIYLDTTDYYVVHGHKVKLVCSRQSPNLTVFLLRPTWPVKHLIAAPTFKMWRVRALNNTVECGSCFEGEHMVAYLIMKNNGGYGKFFLMTEMQWLTQEINTLHDDLQLDFGDFVITPNFFELSRDDFIVCKVDFYGTKSGTCIENLVLVCNNITWESIDFIADVIIFDKYTVTYDNAVMISPFTFENTLNARHSCSDGYIVWNNSHGASYCSLISSARRRDDALEPPKPKHEVHMEGDPSGRPSLEQESVARIDVAMRTSSTDIIDEVIFDYLLGMEKERALDSYASSEEMQTIPPSGVLYFGPILGHQSLIKRITITNNSMINLKYRWELIAINMSDMSNYEQVQLNPIGFDDVSFAVNDDDCLPAYGHIECGIHIRPSTTEEGFYAVGLSLIIEAIPQCAVRLDPANHHFKILPRIEPEKKSSDAPPIVDVQVSLIHAICFVQGMRILVMPRNIFGSHSHCYGTLVRREFKLIIDCDHSGELPGEWLSNKLNGGNGVMVYPESFKIKPKLPKTFVLDYEITSYDDEVQEICVAIASYYERRIELKICVEPPHLKFNRRSLNMGRLIRGNTYVRTFTILNQNLVKVDWEIREQFLKELEISGMNTIEIFASNLSCGDVKITYKVQANYPIKWSSNLVLFTVYNGKVVEECRLAVLYEIVDYTACVHTDYSACSILSPSEVMYVESPKTFALCFHNRTQADAIFEYGGAFGNNAELFNFKCAPKYFTVQPGKPHRVDATITPFKSGIFDDIYLEFHQMETSSYLIGEYHPPLPIVVTVMLAVDDINVKVILPDLRQVMWPPRDDAFVTSSRTDSVIADNADNLNLEDASYTCDESPDNATMAETESYSSDRFGGWQCDGQGGEDGDEMDTLPSDLVRYFKSIEPVEIEWEVETPPVVETTASSFSSDTTITAPSWCRFEASAFANIAEYVVEICAVPLRKIHKSTIWIENQSPVPGILQVETLNFTPKPYEKKRIDAVLQRLNFQSLEDEWEKKVGADGIAIEVACVECELQPFGKSEILLTIYANTWGTYKETLVINFSNSYASSNIQPLKISVIVDIVGVPLEFPIGQNNVHKTAILRFGTLPYKTNFELRHLQVRNVSMIPVTVLWHIFMRHTHADMAKQPITILFDVYHPDDDDLHDEELSSRGNLVIAHGKCVGRSEHRIFKLFPQEMRIASKETLAIKLGVNTKAFAATYHETEIEAYLIGYVYTSSALRHSPLLYKRSTGQNSEPVKAKLTATLDLPVLTLEMDSDDLHFALYADQVIDNNRSKQWRHLTFKNHHAVEAAVRFNMEAPFILDRCRCSANVDMKSTEMAEPAETEEVWYSTAVPPEDSVQLTVSYEIDEVELLRIATCLFDMQSDDITYYFKLNISKHTYNLVKYLNIEQLGFVRQNIPVNLTIYFPILEVPPELDFGDVYIGNVMKQICTIKNTSMCRIDFIVEESATFKVKAISGVVETTTNPERPAFHDLEVVFIPQMQMKFEETVTLRTQIPSLYFHITCTGIGRQNEQYYRPDTC